MAITKFEGECPLNGCLLSIVTIWNRTRAGFRTFDCVLNAMTVDVHRFYYQGLIGSIDHVH